MATNYATQYQEALDQPFKTRLSFEALYSYDLTATRNFRFVRGKTIEISTLTVGGMVDVDRDNITWASRNHSNEWQAYTLSHDREYSTAIDPADIDETNMVYSVANISSTFLREELIPEMDKYMASKLYADIDASAQTIDDTAITDGDSALSVFDSLMEEMDNEEVPYEGRIAYVIPVVHRYLKDALQNSRSLGRTTSTTDVNRIINRLDEVELVKVAPTRMKSEYDFTEGAVEATGAEQIQMIIAHPESIIAPFKIDQALIDEPSAATKGKYPYYQRQYWDVFVLSQKVAGVKINAVA